MTEQVFVAREQELHQLRAFLDRALAGQGTVCFVTGRAESDSRAFVAGALSQAQTMHPTLTVALGECRPGGPPYLPFAEIMRLLTGEVTGDLEDNALSASNADRLRGLLKGSGAALMELGPDLIDTFVPGSSLLTLGATLLAGSVPWLDRLRRRQTAGLEVRQERLGEGRLFEEYGAVLAAIARQQPLALGLLDLQWADEGTIGLLFYLSRRIQDLPMLIIGTYRPDEVAAGYPSTGRRGDPSDRAQDRLVEPSGQAGGRHPLTSTLNEIARYYGPITIALDPLEVEERGQRGKTRRLADRVAEVTPRPPLAVEGPAVRRPPEAVPFTEQRPVPSAGLRACFVGRGRELDQLDGFLNAALEGKGQVLFVTGEAGSGKSTLIQEFTHRAESQHPDLVVAVGDCNAQTGAGDAYLPFREVLGLLTGDVEEKLAEQAISQANADRLQGLLRWSGQALVEFGPDLIDIFVPGSGLLVKGTTLLAEKVGWMDKVEQLVRRRKEEPGVGQAGLEQSHLFEQYTNVIRKLAERNPLLLVLDDLQWADEASTALLFHLGRRIADRRILVIGTYRPNDVAMGRDGDRHPLEPVVAELKRYYARIEVSLDQAAEDANGLRFVSDYVDAACSPHRLDRGFKELIFRRTEGHALFTVELLWNLVERGVLALDDDRCWHQARPVRFEDLPARVEAVIGERIARLEAEAREVLACASVEGEDFTAQVIARVQNLDERQLARRLARELDRQHHLVGERGMERVGRQRLFLWRFRHVLFQDYLYRDLSGMERMLLHEDVGRCLEELYGEEAGRIAVQLSRHFLEAEVYEKAFEYLKLAGEQARAQYANEEAIDYFRTALEVAEEISDDVTDGLIALRGQLGNVLLNIGEYDQALQNYTAALDLLEEFPLQGSTSERMAGLCRKVGMAYRLKGEYATALEWLAQAKGSLYDRRSAEMAHICTSVAAVLSRQGEVTQALEWCRRGLEIAQEVEEQGALAHAYMLRGTIYAELGDLDGAISDCQASLDICQGIGYVLWEAKAENGLGANYHDKGEWDKAIEHYERSLKLREKVGNVEGAATVSNNLGEVYLAQGRLDEARATFQSCLEIWERTGFSLGVALSYANLGKVSVRRGRWQEALDHLERSLAQFEEISSMGWVAAVCQHLAEVHLGLGQTETALELGQRSLDLALERAMTLAEAGARRVMGQAYRAARDWGKAEEFLVSSLHIFEAAQAGYEAAQTLYQLALLHRDRGGAEERMNQALNRAIAIFEELGAGWDLARARQLNAG